MRFENISISECKKLIDDKRGEIFLLDVRGGYECEQGMIAGAVNIPLNELQERSGELPRDQKVIVYCASGNRSQRACGILASLGFDKCTNLDGGIFAWHQAGYEVV